MAISAGHRSDTVQRIDERHEMRMAATVKGYRVAPLTASLIDISAGGAMLSADTSDLHKGDEIVLDAAGKEIVATVAWSSDSMFGLAFHKRLDTREMHWLKRVGRA